MKGKKCPNYTGLACIDGSCPIANMEERIERDMDVIRNCKDCYLYKGCEDCYFAERYGHEEYCIKSSDNRTEREIHEND